MSSLGFILIPTRSNMIVKPSGMLRRCNFIWELLNSQHLGNLSHLPGYWEFTLAMHFWKFRQAAVVVGVESMEDVVPLIWCTVGLMQSIIGLVQFLCEYLCCGLVEMWAYFLVDAWSYTHRIDSSNEVLLFNRTRVMFWAFS